MTRSELSRPKPALQCREGSGVAGILSILDSLVAHNGSVRKFHRLAMRNYHKANMATPKDKTLMKKAMEFEIRACELLKDCQDCEPTRSVLHRSAGWFAVNAGEYARAREIVNQGLEGNPPVWARTELEEILEHLDNKELHRKISSFEGYMVMSPAREEYVIRHGEAIKTNPPKITDV